MKFVRSGTTKSGTMSSSKWKPPSLSNHPGARGISPTEEENKWSRLELIFFHYFHWLRKPSSLQISIFPPSLIGLTSLGFMGHFLSKGKCRLSLAVTGPRGLFLLSYRRGDETEKHRRGIAPVCSTLALSKWHLNRDITAQIVQKCNIIMAYGWIFDAKWTFCTKLAKIVMFWPSSLIDFQPEVAEESYILTK